MNSSRESVRKDWTELSRMGSVRLGTAEHQGGSCLKICSACLPMQYPPGYPETDATREAAVPLCEVVAK